MGYLFNFYDAVLPPTAEFSQVESLAALSQTFSRPTDSKPRDFIAIRSAPLSQPTSGNPADQRSTSATEPERNSLVFSSGKKNIGDTYAVLRPVSDTSRHNPVSLKGAYECDSLLL
jgi:hypothetical protein